MNSGVSAPPFSTANSPLLGKLASRGAPPSSQPSTPMATTINSGTQNTLRTCPVASNCARAQRLRIQASSRPASRPMQAHRCPICQTGTGKLSPPLLR